MDNPQRSPFSLLKWRFFGPMIPPIFGQKTEIWWLYLCPWPNRKSHGRGERLHEDEGRDPGLGPLGLGKNVHINWRWSVDLGAFHSHFWLPQNRKSQANMDDLGVPLFQETPIFFLAGRNGIFTFVFLPGKFQPAAFFSQALEASERLSAGKQTNPADRSFDQSQFLISIASNS